MLTIVIAGCVVVLACWCMLRRKLRHMRSEFQRELGTLSAAIRTLEQDAAGHATAAATSPPADIPMIEIVDAKPTEAIAALPSTDESTAIPLQTQVAIKAALSAFLGHEIRIRSVELVETPDVATAWATQGRIAVQTSHNQRTNRG
jgi:hypothetical protein